MPACHGLGDRLIRGIGQGADSRARRRGPCARRRVRVAGPVGDLLALHEAAGIQLRVLPELSGFWAAVITSSLGFSGVRLRNAARWDPRVAR